MGRRKITVNFPASRDIEIPKGMLRLAAKRTEFLRRLAADRPLRDLFVFAYLQGANDGIDALDARSRAEAHG